VLLILATVHQGMFQKGALNSADWSLKSIGKTLAEKEERMKNSIEQAEPALDTTLNALAKKGVKSTSNVTKELMDTKKFLGDLKTVSNFDKKNTTMTSCNDVALKISVVVYDINKAQKIQLDLELNSTQLQRRMSKINRAFVENYFDKYDYESLNVDSVIGQLEDLNSKMSEYSTTIYDQTQKYVEVNVELIYFKKNNCQCPTQTEVRQKLSMDGIDRKIRTYQNTIEIREAKLRNSSTDCARKIGNLTLEVKKEPSLIFLSSTLDSISDFFNSMKSISTALTVKPTVNCDDAASTIALISFRIDSYYQIGIDAQNNASFVLYNLGNLNVFYSQSLKTLKPGVRNNMRDLLETINSFVEELRQYVLGVSTSIVKFVQLLDEAESARLASCNCTQKMVGASTILALTKAQTTTKAIVSTARATNRRNTARTTDRSSE
jgi:hypothetical protein